MDINNTVLSSPSDSLGDHVGEDLTTSVVIWPES